MTIGCSASSGVVLFAIHCRRFLFAIHCRRSARLTMTIGCSNLHILGHGCSNLLGLGCQRLHASLCSNVLGLCARRVLATAKLLVDSRILASMYLC